MSLGDDLAKETVANRRREALGRLVEMLERKGIDPAEIGQVKRVSLYQSLTKNDEGEAEVHDLAAIQFSPSWETGPEWPVVQPAPMVKLPKRIKTEPKPGAWRKAMILPDIQIGYFRTKDDTLEPTHDEDALQIALDITRAVNPNLVVLVGDNIDAPEFGKYRLSPAFQRTMQASIDRASLLVGHSMTGATHPSAAR